MGLPGPRYHPLLIAQASATLKGMYPGRPFHTVGSGEALNEAALGTGWRSTMGATTVALTNNSGADAPAAIETHGRSVLPKLERKAVKWTNAA